MPNHPGSGFGNRSHPSQLSRGEENGALRNHPLPELDPRRLSVPLISWLRSDIGITLNSADVSAWADQIGAMDFGTGGVASRQPLHVGAGLGGRPELSFDGSAHAMEAGTDLLHGRFTDGNSWAVILVTRNWSFGTHSTNENHYGVGAKCFTGGTGSFFGGSPSSNQTYFTMCALKADKGGVAGGYYGSSHYTVDSDGASAAVAGESLVWMMVNNNGTLFIRTNGTKGSNTISTTNVNAGADYVMIGGVGLSSTASAWDGTLSEILIFDGNLAEDELDEIDAYLAARYGIELD